VATTLKGRRDYLIPDALTLAIDGTRTTVTRATMLRNYRAATVKALANNYSWEHGERWYAECRAELINIASAELVSLRVLAGIVATFSAMMPWERNIAAAVQVVRAYNAGKRGSELPAVTRNFGAVLKAEKMLAGAEPSQTIVARKRTIAGQSFKTLSFFYNILGARNIVTVDVWMWRVLTGMGTSEHRPEGHLYVMCADVMRQVAYEFGIAPADLQAIVWVDAVVKPAR